MTAGTAAGEAVITGTVNDVPLAHTASVQFMPGPASADQTIFSADRAVVTADGLSRSNVTVQLKDAYGNELRSDAGSLQLKLASTLGLLTEPKYEADGRYTAGVASNTAGTAVITGTLDGIRIASAVTVSFEPGEPSALASTITVSVRDAFGNSTGNGADIRLETTLGTVTEATYRENGLYTAEVRSTEPGVADIRAWIGGEPIQAGVQVTFADGLWFTPPSYRLQIGESVRTVIEATYGDAVSDVTPDARIQYDDGLIRVAQAEDGYWYVTGLVPDVPSCRPFMRLMPAG